MRQPGIGERPRACMARGGRCGLEARSSEERRGTNRGASEVVGIHVRNPVEGGTGGDEMSMVEADERGEDQAGAAEGEQHFEVLLDGEGAESMGGGKQAHQEDAQEADLAEGGIPGRVVKHFALCGGKELAVELVR